MIASKNLPQSASRFGHWLPRIVVAVFVPLLLLALIEGALHLFNVGYSTSLMEPCTVHGRPYSCYNLFFAAPFFPPGVIKTPQFYTISNEKPSGTYRIFVFGESAAEGDPDFAYGFARYLEVMLRDRFPKQKFEIVNTGMVAINSNVTRLIARDLANYKPDFYFIYAGSNEVVGPYGPGTVLTSSLISRPMIRASIFVRSTRIGQLLTSTGAPHSDWRGMEMFLNKEVRADSSRLGPAYENFAANLIDIVSYGTAAGARVLLSTVATNLKDCAPFGSLHREGLSADALRKWSSFVQQGAEMGSMGANAEALKQYLSAAQIDDQYAELQFRIARSQWLLGDYAAARDHFTRARDLDVLRFRADSRINEIVRSVAASSGPAVQLLDTQALFAQESHNGIAGSELLYDHVHLTPLGSYLVARSAFQQIVSDLPSDVRASARSTDPPSEADCERLLAFTSHDRARVAQEMVERLTRPPFTTQLNHSEQVQSLMLRAAGSTETPEDTLHQYQWAIARAPDDLTLHYKFGFFLFDFNREAAGQELMRARPNDEFPVFLPDGTRIQ
jgi:tetratricopeptide (TPR) repeat protein